MKCYTFGEMDIADPSWISEYVAKVTGMVEQHGGRYLARTAQIEKIEGERARPQACVLIEWPSREAADEFYESEEYRPYREARMRGASNEFVLVTGEDVNNQAQVPG
jgi:uncharacterized protein (DUF1330 family)